MSAYAYRGGAPRLYADARERAREKQRRRRARRHAAGLTSSGQPVTRPDIQRFELVRCGTLPHPKTCLCRDCLFPPEEYRPAIARYLGVHRR